MGKTYVITAGSYCPDPLRPDLLIEAGTDHDTIESDKPLDKMFANKFEELVPKLVKGTMMVRKSEAEKIAKKAAEASAKKADKAREDGEPKSQEQKTEDIQEEQAEEEFEKETGEENPEGEETEPAGEGDPQEGTDTEPALDEEPPAEDEGAVPTGDDVTDEFTIPAGFESVRVYHTADGYTVMDGSEDLTSSGKLTSKKSVKSLLGSMRPSN